MMSAKGRKINSDGGVGGNGVQSSLETTGNRQMEMSTDIFYVGDTKKRRTFLNFNFLYCRLHLTITCVFLDVPLHF
jgi:hypothetical protein